MTDFKGTSERFRLSMLQSDGSSERVTIQIGLDGLKVLSADGSRPMRSFELGHISRWQSRGTSLVLYTKTPVDVEEKQITLQGDENVVRNALDTLTCCCMQLCEILQHKSNDAAKETANNLHALVSGGGKKKTSLPSADDVSYWTSPDKSGWLQCQGEHLRSWRKRWFVLKSGYLFRFKDSNVTEASKPRGVVDLSKIQDVSEAKATTGRPNSFQLKTSSGGSVAYIADSETEVVEWMSALEGAMAKIMRTLAGVDDEVQKPSAREGPSGGSNEWMKQLVKGFESVSTGSNASGGNLSSGRSTNPLVSVVGYESPSGGSSRATTREPANDWRANERKTNVVGGSRGASSLAYDQIAGVAGVVTSDMDLNYGGSAYRSNTSSSVPAPAAAPYSASSNYSAYSSREALAVAPPMYSYPQAAPSYSNGQVPYSAPAPALVQQSSYGGASYATPATVAPSGGQYGGLTLLDQAPAAPPAYPYFQHSSSMPMASPVSSPPQWQVHYTGDGRPYYYNSMTGGTQWEVPAGFA